VRRRRLAAAAARGLPALALAGAVVITAVREPGYRLAGVILLGLSLVVASRGILSGGVKRWSLLALAVLLLAGGASFLPWGSPGLLVLDVVIILALAGGVACARMAFRVRVPLEPVPPPKRPVLFWNPRSGGGSAVRHHLADEARARGIEAIELKPGDDLRSLVVDAVAGGADAVAAAGGDGTQAIVAEVAAERGLAFACIPAGTRNHFALDLGVDRTDVVGALGAFVDGGERCVDLPQVNGRTFVNNVSLGLYAESVAARDYREAKLRTMLATAGRAQDFDLEWTGPHGHSHRGGIAVLVSNNRYRLGVMGAGTRPRNDEGLLGITVLGSPEQIGERPRPLRRPWRQWSAPEFEVRADRPVPTGIDGESILLDPPLRFTVRPGALRVRISRLHPGASPSAGTPDRLVDMARTLGRLAAGRQPSARGPQAG
jgi:diacylglycerol kinase family enzyme